MKFFQERTNAVVRVDVELDIRRYNMFSNQNYL